MRNNRLRVSYTHTYLGTYFCFKQIGGKILFITVKNDYDMYFIHDDLFIHD